VENHLFVNNNIIYLGTRYNAELLIARGWFTLWRLKCMQSIIIANWFYSVSISVPRSRSDYHFKKSFDFLNNFNLVFFSKINQKISECFKLFYKRKLQNVATNACKKLKSWKSRNKDKIILFVIWKTSFELQFEKARMSQKRVNMGVISFWRIFQNHQTE